VTYAFVSRGALTLLTVLFCFVLVLLSACFVCSVWLFGLVVFFSVPTTAKQQRGKKKTKKKNTQKTEPPTSELNHPRPTKQWET
jgi:predicted membrane protein